MSLLGDRKLRIALIGATGAIGREIVDAAFLNENLAELIVIVRRRLDDWTQSTNLDFKFTVIQ